jgi:hypothetical protein
MSRVTHRRSQDKSLRMTEPDSHRRPLRKWHNGSSGFKQVGQLNDCELRRADSEIKDLVDGRYDGRIRRFENHHGGLSR